MTEHPVAIIGKGMIGISLAVLFTGNGVPAVVLAKNSEAESPSPSVFSTSLSVPVSLSSVCVSVSSIDTSMK